ncbi:BapA/Bap/LapF family prefix-like domain-containing protein [Sulfitobacter geojensis]|uniref:BapA/Bap/LapF family prefix-like domain-containing protein n=1 Tax=Sulfitobacter geojensis TaxID=1342299 RepID=UPI0036D8F85D
MKAIDFVVRDNAGGLQRGTVPEGAKTHAIQAGAGQEISLNLRQVDLSTQVREGSDLVITLTDGRQITIDNYFNGSGTPNRLFISADGYLNEVAFVDTGAGELYAQFGPTEQWGKWSPSDDLIYLGRTELAAAGYADDEVSMFPAPLLGAAGLLGGGTAATAAAVVGAPRLSVPVAALVMKPAVAAKAATAAVTPAGQTPTAIWFRTLMSMIPTLLARLAATMPSRSSRSPAAVPPATRSL